MGKFGQLHRESRRPLGGVSAGFVRLMTRPNFLSCPATPTEAVDYVREWFRFPPPIPVNLGSSHLTYFRQKLVAAGVGANMVTDAQIAALAMEYQAEVHSNDTDFGRFPGLWWCNHLR